MAVLTDRVSSRLSLVFKTGEDAQGMPILKRKAYSRINPAAADEAVYEIATALASLQTLPLYGVERIDTNSVEEI